MALFQTWSCGHFCPHDQVITYCLNCVWDVVFALHVDLLTGGYMTPVKPQEGYSFDGFTSIVGGANTSTGLVTIHGEGSKWIQEATALVGFEGTGALDILDGGCMECVFPPVQ